MRTFLYRCPATGFNVQGLGADHPDAPNDNRLRSGDLHFLPRCSLGQSKNRPCSWRECEHEALKIALGSSPRWPRSAAPHRAASHNSCHSVKPPIPCGLSRLCISFPVLKEGTAFCATGTSAPVRGLRPWRAPRSLAENTPKPRSSTRSPRRKASIISSNMALIIFSMSRGYRCGF